MDYNPVMRQLDIGIASYGAPDKLNTTLGLLRAHCKTDWRCLVVHNPHPDEETDGAAFGVATVHAGETGRIKIRRMNRNVGYAGAVNEIFRWAQTEYIAYCDNDAHVQTPGWDETMAGYLDRFHEIGWIAPGGYGAYPIDRGAWQEIQWSIGCFWMVNRLVISGIAEFFGPADDGLFDTAIGHQNECDYCLRLRMAGWRCASAPEVSVVHQATATNDPASVERISKGVIEFVNKWNRKFGGKDVNYFSEQVLRWEDFPPNVHYMERFWKANGLTQLNANPEVMNLLGREYDLIRIPKFKGFYRSRIA